MNLTPHFSKEELEASAEAAAHGINNSIPKELLPKAKVFCEALERVRTLLCKTYETDVPMLITSGYRCPQLNELVGGKPTSQHLLMEAADFHIPESLGTPSEVWEYIRKSNLPYDQLILEHDSNGTSWVHYSMPTPGKVARRMAFRLEKS